MGFADINALVEFNVANPGQAAKAVMMVYDAPPFGVYALKKSGIAAPRDLEGKRLGAPVFDASYKLFPAFAAKTGIDNEAVRRVNMDPPLREAMLVRGEVEVISGHYFSSLLDLQSKGVKAEDIVALLYKDYGMDFYGNAVIAAGAFLAAEPEAVRAFNTATVRGMRWVIENPDAAIDLVAKVDPLIDRKLERTRLAMALEGNILTPTVRSEGMGGVDPARLQRSIDQIAAAVKLEETPAVAAIWSPDYLPPPEARRLLP
jgi:NitT/TauT family transport system substrate-binding protein